MARFDTRDPMPFYVMTVIAVGLLGIAAARWLPRTRQEQLSAFFGVAAATFSGVVALSLKRLALSRAIKWVLGVVGAVFFLRLLLAVVGLIAVKRMQASIASFVIGFFAVYFVLQWIEIRYVMVESKRRAPGVK